jgi:hypothetical protein
MRELRIYAAVIVWWLLMLSIPFWPLATADRVAAFALVAVAPFAFMAWRKRSAHRALYSVVSWCFNAAGLVMGLLAPRVPPRKRIASLILHEPPQSMRPRRRNYAS